MIWALAGLLGLTFGSFFNVCIYRLPRGKSLAWPPSHCPHCRKPIRPYDNIPVLSYVMLRARCRECGKPISVRYPLVEAITGLLFVAAVARFGLEWMTLKAIVFISLLMITAFIDLDLQIIPFRISATGLGLGLAGGLLPPPMLRDALLGAAIGAGFIGLAWGLWRYLLAPLFRRFGIDQKEGMGGGDLPYAAMIGAFIGPRSLAVALFAAVIFGVLGGLTARTAGRNRAGQPIPFGPFLALGGLLGLFWGDAIFGWYVRFVGLSV